MYVPQRLRENKVYQKQVKLYGKDAVLKRSLPCIYDMVDVALNVTRKTMGKARKDAFTFYYLPNKVDIGKGRIRLRNDVAKRTRLFYSFRTVQNKSIPVFMDENVTEGRYLDTGEDVFLFHKYIESLKESNELEVIVGFRGVELRSS